MCLLLESIRLDHGRAKNLSAHQLRMDQSCLHLFGQLPPNQLETLVSSYLKNPDYAYLHEGLYKMRLLYDNVNKKVDFVPYNLPVIETLQLVYEDQIEYPFKTTNRDQLLELYTHKGSCDDIMIVRKGLVTDSSYANLAFFDGKQWLTPERPLLNGTRRASLLQQNRIHPAAIQPEYFHRFTIVRLFNAMIRWEDQLDILIENISF